MEKLPHQEYRDELAGKLKEIRNSDTENPEVAKAKAEGYLEAMREHSSDYKDAESKHNYERMTSERKHYLERITEDMESFLSSLKDLKQTDVKFLSYQINDKDGDIHIKFKPVSEIAIRNASGLTASRDVSNDVVNLFILPNQEIITDSFKAFDKIYFEHDALDDIGGGVRDSWISFDEHSGKWYNRYEKFQRAILRLF